MVKYKPCFAIKLRHINHHLDAWAVGETDTPSLLQYNNQYEKVTILVRLINYLIWCICLHNGKPSAFASTTLNYDKMIYAQIIKGLHGSASVKRIMQHREPVSEERLFNRHKLSTQDERITYGIN